MSHGAQHHFNTLAANELERRNEIAVASHYRYRPNCVPERQARHVQTNTNVDALLIDIQSEVAVG